MGKLRMSQKLYLTSFPYCSPAYISPEYLKIVAECYSEAVGGHEPVTTRTAGL
jgi:hypothetical protein